MRFAVKYRSNLLVFATIQITCNENCIDHNCITKTTHNPNPCFSHSEYEKIENKIENRRSLHFDGYLYLHLHLHLQRFTFR